jgi:hypothetical protein
MAYQAFQETTGGQVVLDRAPVPPAAPAATARTVSPLDVPTARLSALEWSVVALAERDRLSTLRTPGRVAIALGRLFGDTPNPRLADPRLEALRRVAVLTWHHGYTIPSAEVRAFLAAGFTNEQYELLVDSIGRGRAAANARRFQR